MRCIVDTNVAVVAQGLTPEVDEACAHACRVRLEGIVQTGGLLLDDRDLIIEEYMSNLGWAGTPGLGKIFVKWAFNHRFDSKQVGLVPVTPLHGPGWREFQEFPDVPGLERFDRSDQKFVAVAVASGRRSPIVNAVDSDWANHHTALAAAGVRVEFLCPQHCTP